VTLKIAQNGKIFVQSDHTERKTNF